MTSRQVVLYGSPGVGKSTILYAFSEASECLVHSEMYGTSRLLHLEMTSQDLTFHSMSSGQAAKDTDIPKLLGDATMLLYVLSAEPSRQQEQIAEFLSFAETAEKLEKSWKTIPWVVILNFMDRGSDMTALGKFPTKLRNSCICTRANDPNDEVGLPAIWQRIQEIP